ncbi:MAG: DNA gyrase inhibitor YacG [Burkholderiales bacterium]|nr:DNA gyrase inhibitor YacG [Burkholderiales bacterium]
MSAPRIVACPRCGTPVPWVESSRWRPFCSARCKLVDLGDWASERYRIPGVESGDPGGASDAAPTPPRDD